MALRTLEFPWPNGTPNLAAGATFTSPLINVLTERPAASDTWECISAKLEIYCHNNGAAAFDMASYTIGFGRGTTLPTTADYTTEVTTNATVGIKAGTLMFSRDLTSWFNTTLTASDKSSLVAGSGTGIGYTFSLTTSGGTTISLTNFTAKLIITVHVTESAGKPLRRCNMVRIPMDGRLGHLPLTTTWTAYAVGNLPALNTFLPEGGKTIQAAWVEIEGNDQSSGTADLGLAMRCDNIVGSDVTFGSTIKSQNLANFFKLHYLIPSAYWTAAYTLNLLAVCGVGTKNAFYHPSFVLHVVYTYTPASTTRCLISQMLVHGHEAPFGRVNINERVKALIQEQNPTLVQSGVVMNWTCSSNSTKGVRVKMEGHADYAYLTAASAGSIATQAGQEQYSFRFDPGGALGAGVSIARGMNDLSIMFYQTAQSTNDTSNRPAMINFRTYLNYTCDAPSSDYETYPEFGGTGPYTYNNMSRTIYKGLFSSNSLPQFQETGLITSNMNIPNNYGEDGRYVTNLAMDWRALVFGQSANVRMGVLRMTTEPKGQAFLPAGVAYAQWAELGVGVSKSDAGSVISFRCDFNRHFRPSWYHPADQGLDWFLVDRRFLVENQRDVVICSDSCMWETSSGIFQTKFGSVVKAGESLTGQVVDVFDQNDVHVYEATCNAAGSFSAIVFDDTIQYYAVARRGLKAGSSLLF
jgi:hypothetical protein